MKDVYNLNFNGNNFEIIIRAEDGETTNAIPIYVYRYKHIETVNIIPDQIAVNIGETSEVEYEYTPDNTDYTEFTWTTMNPEVATVDSTGKVTGISEGITYVYITSTVADAVNDYVLVYVSSKYITSDIYTVWHVGDSDNELATVSFNYVIGANDKTSYEEFKYKFNNNPDNLIVKSNGKEINLSDYVGSGMTLSLVMNNVVYDEVVIVVRGDNGTLEKPGNGIITSTDYATLAAILAGITPKTEIISLLYDLNKNKILTVTDLSPISLYIAGKASFTDLNGLT